MKKKKLKLMNVNEDQKLNRYDMKSIIAGSGGGDYECPRCIRQESGPAPCIYFDEECLPYHSYCCVDQNPV